MLKASGFHGLRLGLWVFFFRAPFRSAEFRVWGLGSLVSSLGMLGQE